MNVVNTVGCFENVSFPQLGVVDKLAKVDTGAYSGALHCSNIRGVRRGDDRVRVLRFNPIGDSQLAAETEEFETTYVRTSAGHRIKRYVIMTKMIIKDKECSLKIGLYDRKEMKRPVLVGRRFLRDNDMIVDVRINSEFDDEGENTR